MIQGTAMARELVGEWQGVATCLGPLTAAAAPQPGPLLQLNCTHSRPIGDDNELHDQQELLQQSFVADASHIATSLLGAGFCTMNGFAKWARPFSPKRFLSIQA